MDIPCSDAIAGEACFGTFACGCDNGYYLVSSTMPAFAESTTMRYADILRNSMPIPDGGSGGSGGGGSGG